MNILRYIRKTFFVSISRKKIKNLIESNNDYIIIRRHNIFALNIVGLMIVSCLLMTTYWWLVYTQFEWLSSHVITYISIGLFFIRIIFSISSLTKGVRSNEATFTKSNSKKLLNVKHIDNYISYGILVIGILYIDIIITLILQFNSIDGNIRGYILEILIFIAFIFINKKIIKLYLDFEMDMIIISNWSMQYINREWFYKVESKVFIGTQIQGIEINQSTIVDSICKKGTMIITTSKNNLQGSQSQYEFSPIKYSQTLEDDIQNVLSTKS